MRAIVVLGGLLIGAPALAAPPFPARSGESGLLDVPDAEVVQPGRAQMAAELRLDAIPGDRADFGPLPISVVAGLPGKLELGLTMRESGQPGDPVPSRVQFGAAAKLQLLAPRGRPFGLAVDTVLDRLNTSPVVGGRLIASTPSVGNLRFAAFAGAEAATTGDDFGVTAGGAAAARFRGAEYVVEATGGPRGGDFGAAVRWNLKPTYGVSVSLNYLPGDDLVRLSVGLAFGPPRKDRGAQSDPRPTEQPQAQAEAPEARTGPVFLDERPRFRLRIPISSLDRLANRRLPSAGSAASAKPTESGMPPPALPKRAPAPSAEDLLAQRLAETAEALGSRDQRLRDNAERLDARRAAAEREASALEDRRRDLEVREQHLASRQTTLGRAAATAESRRLESFEAQLRAEERRLAATDQSFTPAIEAAAGAVREAGSREALERAERERLDALASGARARTEELELRTQALAAGKRHLASVEARLVAENERLDAIDQQLDARRERLDVAHRRVDAAAERLALLERQRAVADARPESSGPTPAPVVTGTTEKKETPVFVLVVKSPAAVVKQRAAGATPQAAATAPAVPTAPAVENAAAVATIVQFPTAASVLDELDREAIDRLVAQAVKTRAALLVWARARDMASTAEAQRRAEQIKSIAVNAGIEPTLVTIRVTTRPGAAGIDVVVSLVQQQGAKTPPPASPPAAGASAPAAAEPRLTSPAETDSGRRMIRETVLLTQKSIQSCISAHLEAQHRTHAEGVFRITVAPDGRVSGLRLTGGDLGGAELEGCLTRAAGGWRFPTSASEYVVDVPITVVGQGSDR